MRLQPLPTTTTDQLTDLCAELTALLPSATTVVVDVTDPRNGHRSTPAATCDQS